MLIGNGKDQLLLSRQAPSITIHRDLEYFFWDSLTRTPSPAKYTSSPLFVVVGCIELRTDFLPRHAARCADVGSTRCSCIYCLSLCYCMCNLYYTAAMQWILIYNVLVVHTSVRGRASGTYDWTGSSSKSRSYNVGIRARGWTANWAKVAVRLFGSHVTRQFSCSCTTFDPLSGG